MTRYLIVNADDFGTSPGVNRGVVEAHEAGIVTSASLMVRGPAAAEAAALGNARPSLAVGLHVDLGEWEFAEGEWRPLYEVVDVGDSAAVRAEVEAQLESFVALIGDAPTHLDSHQHVHRTPPVRDAVADAGRRLGVPVRHFSPQVSYCGAFYGQLGHGEPYPEGITVERLLAIIDALPHGVTELACHAGYDDGLRTMYRHERETELRALCDPCVRRAVEDRAVLCSFADLTKTRPRGL